MQIRAGVLQRLVTLGYRRRADRVEATGAALCLELVLQGQRVVWTRTATLMQCLLATARDVQLPRELPRLNRFAGVILDDIG